MLYPLSENKTMHLKWDCDTQKMKNDKQINDGNTKGTRVDMQVRHFFFWGKKKSYLRGVFSERIEIHKKKMEQKCLKDLQ